MGYYIQLDENNMVETVMQSKTEPGNSIEVAEYDSKLLGKRYNHETKEFEEVIVEEEVIPE